MSDYDEDMYGISLETKAMKVGLKLDTFVEQNATTMSTEIAEELKDLRTIVITALLNSMADQDSEVEELRGVLQKICRAAGSAASAAYLVD